MGRSTDHHVDAARHSDDVEADAEIVMFFLGPDGALLDGADDAPRKRTIAEVRRAWRAALESEAPDPTGRHRRAPRAVQGTGRPSTHGHRDEIVVTARARPEHAVAVAIDPDFFLPPIDRLYVDGSSIRSRRYELTWEARLTLRIWHRRPVRFRLYASPSHNVTVLALSPVTARPAARRRFLRIGNRALAEVRDRLDDRAAPDGQRCPGVM
jgi:hypothetical protein